jgi:hypothetical protein
MRYETRKLKSNQRWWNELRNVELKPFWMDGNKIHINRIKNPKAYVLFCEAIDMALITGTVIYTKYEDVTPNHLYKLVYRTYALNDVKFYFEEDLYYYKDGTWLSKEIIEGLVFEMEREEYEYYRCVLHIFQHARENGRPVQLEALKYR